MVLSRCAMVMTVVSLDCSFMIAWMKLSVAMSTFEVASSSTRNLFRRSSALARQSSCFWPTEKHSEVFEMSVSSFCGS